MSNAYAQKSDSPAHTAKAAELRKKAEALRDAETDADMKGIYEQVLQGAGGE